MFQKYNVARLGPRLVYVHSFRAESHSFKTDRFRITIEPYNRSVLILVGVISPSAVELYPSIGN